MIIRTATMQETHEHVYSLDPALDRDSVDENGEPDFQERYRLFIETSDYRQLPLREGQTPAVWELRHLRGQERRELEAMRRTKPIESLIYYAAKMALVGVTGVHDDRGEEITIDRVATSAGRYVVSDHRMEWLDSLEEEAHGVDGRHLVNELGLRVLDQMRPAKK